MIVNNLAELKKKIMEEANRGIQTVVADEIKKDMLVAYQKDGYDKYNNWEYERHYNKGGMTDPTHIKIIPSNNQVEIKNITIHDGNEIAPIWEYGGNRWKKPYDKGKWTIARPVIKNLKEALLASDKVTKLLKEHFKSKGFDVK